MRETCEGTSGYNENAADHVAVATTVMGQCEGLESIIAGDVC